jgi:chloramphenicol 3-O phosphotransferase
VRTGSIVVLNGAPRSGKSTTVAAIQETLRGTWMNLGVDVSRLTTPPSAQPGIGLRPGEQAHPSAVLRPVLYAAFWESVAAHARVGLDVAVDVGLYEPSLARDAAERLAGLPVLFVGVRCPLAVVLERRGADPGEPTPTPVLRWQDKVHAHWEYDLEIDTSVLTPRECASAIGKALVDPPVPSAFAQLATFLT